MSDLLTFLVASPQLNNSFFEKTVVLMLAYQGKGSIGLTVNFPSAVPITELLETSPVQGSAWVGGPIEPYIGWCLYQRPTGMRGEKHLAQDLYMGTSAEVLDVLQVRGQDFRLLMGYAGWDVGQLERETHEGLWLWLESGPELIFDIPFDECWKTAYTKTGVDPGDWLGRGAQA